MTRKEHIYAIQNLRNKGPKSDDSRISNRLVSHFLNVSRARVIKQKMDKQNFISDLNRQSFCMPLELTTYYDCSCVPDEAKCQILRSEKKIPKDIVLHMGTSIRVKTIDGSKIDRGTPVSHKHSQYSLTNATTLKWFIENSYLYILGSLTLPTVVIEGVWEDPDLLVGYTSCSDSTDSQPCYDPDSDEFPLDSELVDPVYRLTLEFLAVSDKYPEDLRNDAKDVQTVPTN